jgi:hypothetical protein
LVRMKYHYSMKTLIFIIIVMFIAALLYVTHLPPRQITLKDLSPSNYSSTNTNTNEPSKLENAPIDSSEADGDDNVLVDYYIIVESCKNPSMALQRAEKLKKEFNKNFIVLPPTAEGRCRISCGKYSTLDEAKTNIESIRTSIRSDVWILSSKN